MNRIIVNDEIIFNLNDKIKYTYEKGFINKLEITIIKTTTLEIKYINTNVKLDIVINILENQKLNLREILKNSKVKILSQININKKSNLNYIKISDSIGVNYRNIINLNSIYASVNLLLKTMNKKVEKYDVIINHNKSYTLSKIIMEGINYGTLTFNSSIYIKKNSLNCNSNINERIINLSEKDCILRPNIITDEKAIIKNKSYVGLFKEDELNKYKNCKPNEIKNNILKDFISNGLNKSLNIIYKKYF